MKQFGLLLMTISLSLVTQLAEAADSKSHEIDEAKATARRARLYKKFGGRINNFSAMKGRFVFINAQNRVGSNVISETVSSMRDFFMCDFRLVSPNEDKSAVLSSIGKQLQACNALAGVAIVAEDGLPGLLTNPEGPWAVINVTALSDRNDQQLTRRVKLEMWRSLGYLCVPNFDSCMLRQVKNLEELDGLPNAMCSEALYRTRSGLDVCGLKPWINASYRTAVKEGWAPAPTNDVQKAIWDEIHSLPDKPMKITFDPATQKGKVTK